MTKSDIAEQLAEKGFRELGYDPKTKTFKPPVSSRTTPVHPPFRIPALEKTQRQAQKTTGYKASAHWQTASLLRDLILIFLETLPKSQFRRKAQLEDAARSLVSTIEEGWARPTTKEYLDFLGFSQGSLAEIRGDVERLLADGLIETGNYGKLRESTGTPVNLPSTPVNSRKFPGIPTPSRTSPYPPVASRRNPAKYGSIRARLREYTGGDIEARDITYEVFYEFVNKTDHLLKRAVQGLQEKIIRDEKENLRRDLEKIHRDW